jgi:hypothetical protein
LNICRPLINDQSTSLAKLSKTPRSFIIFFALLKVRGCRWPEIPASIRQCTLKQAQAAVDELVLLCRLYHAAPAKKKIGHMSTRAIHQQFKCR